MRCASPRLRLEEEAKSAADDLYRQLLLLRSPPSSNDAAQLDPGNFAGSFKLASREPQHSVASSDTAAASAMSRLAFHAYVLATPFRQVPILLSPSPLHRRELPSSLSQLSSSTPAFEFDLPTVKGRCIESRRGRGSVRGNIVAATMKGWGNVLPLWRRRTPDDWFPLRVGLAYGYSRAGMAGPSLLSGQACG